MQIEQLMQNMETYKSDRAKLQRDGKDFKDLDIAIQKLQVILALANSVWPLAWVYDTWMKTPNSATVLPIGLSKTEILNYLKKHLQACRS